MMDMNERFKELLRAALDPIREDDFLADHAKAVNVRMPLHSDEEWIEDEPHDIERRY